MKHPATIPMQPMPPPCPVELPPEAQAEYDRLAAMVTGLKPEDGYQLAMLAQCWITWTQANADVNRLGNVVSSGGTAIANPSLAIRAQALNQILAISKELGIGPIQRKKKRK
jgi:phage terminase small subunit